MSKTRLRIHPASTVLIGLALAAPACGGVLGNNDADTETGTSAEDPTGQEDPTGDGDGDATTTATTGGEEMTIYAIQQGGEDGSVGDGTLVNLGGVIVTTPLDAEDGLIFVEEPEGGEWSGVSLYLWDEVVMAMPGLAPGDQVDLVGEYTEFFGMSQIIVRNPGDLVVTGTAAVPGPDTVSAADIAKTNAAAEPWEGVRVCIDDATIAEGNDGFGQYLLEGDVLVSYAFVGGMLPAASPGGVFSQICGSLHYSFDEFKLQPASIDDLAGYVAPEAVAATVMEVQMGVHPEDTPVELTDVVVTSGLTWTDGTDASFFVQDPGGGEWSGIAVYVANTAGVTVAPGDVVTITGIYTEFFDMSQVSTGGSADITVSSGGPAPAPDLIADPASIATGGAMAENWEGCLVTVGPVVVTDDNPDAPDDFGDFAIDGGLRVGDVFFSFDDWQKPAVDTPFASLTGLLIYDFNNSKLAPRDGGDLVP